MSALLSRASLVVKRNYTIDYLGRDEINRLYEQVLDIMAIPERAREPTMGLPNIDKWKQICLHKDNIRSDQSVFFVSCPFNFDQ